VFFWGDEMQIQLAGDNSVGFSLKRLSGLITSKRTSLTSGVSDVRLRPTDELFSQSSVSKYKLVAPKTADDETKFFLTLVPFDDNYFYHGSDGWYIISLNGWSHITDVPLVNGALHLICRILLKHDLGVGGNNEGSTGCLNDFMWDKRIIDAAIRASYFCASCLDKTPIAVKNSSIFSDLMGLLEFDASLSRARSDVLDQVSELNETKSQQITNQFDVFLCHNSTDKTAVRQLNQSLLSEGLRTWFDEDQIQPGMIWQSELEKAIPRVRGCAVCVGPAGEGPWQEVERRAFISEFVQRGLRVIPVILPGCTSVPELPIFLRQFMWSDLREDVEKALGRLASALRSQTL
jgi:hypothetical protein